MADIDTPEGPKLVQALGKEFAEMIKPDSAYRAYERNAKDYMAHILSDPKNTGTDQHGYSKSTFPKDWGWAGVKPEFVEKHQKDIIRIAEEDSKNGSSQNDVDMLSFTFSYPSSAFKSKAAELLDAMEIDMLDNFDGYDDWVKNGSDSPNREVEDLTDELIELDSTGGDTFDAWIIEVAYPYIEKNNSVDEGTFTRTRLMELAGIKSNNKRII
tara:strand:+ start:1190 stop:1828 length:639 start_codon:yes stop_codon:yes gene_type:complete